MYAIAGGWLVLPAIAMLAAAVLVDSISRWRLLSIIATLAALLAIAAISISSVTLPWWFLIIWGLQAILWLFLRKSKSRWLPASLRSALLIFTFLAGAVEFSYQQLRSLPTGSSHRLTVLGDSITAGLGRSGEVTWPKILRSKYGAAIIDLSQAGCTVGQALRNLKQPAPADSVVLVELGGNDVIGQTDSRQFGADLDQLVRRVQRPGQAIVMFELPLFPFDNAYGIEQRRAAAKYQIDLIPRRFLAEIFASPGATVDGIHLTNAGQQRLAELVWQVVGPALSGGKK